MDVQRDRLAMLKAAHLKMVMKVKKKIAPAAIKEQPKAKRPYKSRPKMSPEERKSKRYACQRARLGKFAEEGLCIRCGRAPLETIFTSGGVELFRKKSVFCPIHTKGCKFKGEFRANVADVSIIPTHTLPFRSKREYPMGGNSNDPVKASSEASSSDPGAGVLLPSGSPVH